MSLESSTMPAFTAIPSLLSRLRLVRLHGFFFQPASL